MPTHRHLEEHSFSRIRNFRFFSQPTYSPLPLFPPWNSSKNRPHNFIWRLAVRCTGHFRFIRRLYLLSKIWLNSQSLRSVWGQCPWQWFIVTTGTVLTYGWTFFFKFVVMKKQLVEMWGFLSVTWNFYLYEKCSVQMPEFKVLYCSYWRYI